MLLAPFFLFVILGSAIAEPEYHPDRVISLPSAPIEPTFPLFSGFLQATDNNTEYKLFYVLCEAVRANPSDAPLIVWLNGGPGSSSLFGMFLGHGPYLLDAETLQLHYNEFSWNQYANVLYLESPSGVGFSHSNATSQPYNDISTAKINRKALQDFMTRVHPRYASRNFYITGESYAGVYVPYLAREILQHTQSGGFTNSNFRGIAMGNAHVDNFSEDVASALQLYSLGMIAEKYGVELFEAWAKIITGNHDIRISPELEDQFLEAKYNRIGGKAVYNMQLQCNHNMSPEKWHVRKSVRIAECVPESLLQYYLNRKDVQIRLNARTVDQSAVRWRMHSDAIFFNYVKEADTVPIYKDIFALVQADFRILFYTGDMDLICPPLQVAYGGRRIAEQNGMTEVETLHWMYLNDHGGARTSYISNDGRMSLDVLTVRGSSHSVAVTNPDRAFQLINNFVSAEPRTEIDYSKLIPRK